MDNNHKGLRTYTQHKHGKNMIVAWIIKQCNKCGKFLSKKKCYIKYCSSCSKKVRPKQTREWIKNHREIANLRQRVYCYPDRYNVGDIV